ncbi:Alb1-domain-containing protein [Fusarium acuminatum]|uniref:Alb1-domain-containing protein n=1 Tax=Fusarium acuminatum TaxID=5515 RepID=A0ABZ2WQF8_9HYPO
MAKKKAPSIRSRAARRTTDIDIDTDKSLKEVKPPPRDTPQRPSVLAAQHSAGVTKKTKRGRNLSTRARKRQEKGLEMAEAIAERTKTKVEKSKGRGKNIQQRSKNWDDINKAAEEDEEVQESDGDEEVKKTEHKWEMDEEMNGADETTPTTDVKPAPDAAPLPADEDGDEIL